MHIVIEPTDIMTRIDGQPARLWRGVTDQGVRCVVFVQLIGVAENEDTLAFDVALQEIPAPAASVPLWKICPARG